MPKIAARKGEDYYLLDLDEVFAFQADREIVWIRTRDKSYMATQTLQAIDERFSGTQFQRVHRSVLVNHQQDPQGKRTQQPALVVDPDQRTGIHREQAAGSPASGPAALTRIAHQWQETSALNPRGV